MEEWDYIDRERNRVVEGSVEEKSDKALDREEVGREKTQHTTAHSDPFGYNQGPDLSDDPMMAEDRPKSRRQLRRERGERRTEERLERQKEVLRREILVELKRDGVINSEGELIEGAETQDDGRTYVPPVKPTFGQLVMNVLSGNILSRSSARRVYPYLLFSAILLFIYIGNVFDMQRLHRKHEQLNYQVKQLRAKSLTLASQKMNDTRQSNIVAEIERRQLPLRESLTPNPVIPK